MAFLIANRVVCSYNTLFNNRFLKIYDFNSHFKVQCSLCMCVPFSLTLNRAQSEGVRAATHSYVLCCIIIYKFNAT